MSDITPPCWADFSDKEGRTYTVVFGSNHFELKLECAEKLGGSARSGGAFRLDFRGPFEPLLPQGIYRITAGKFEKEVFLVPVGRDDQSSSYEAIFN